METRTARPSTKAHAPFQRRELGWDFERRNGFARVVEGFMEIPDLQHRGSHHALVSLEFTKLLPRLLSRIWPTLVPNKPVAPKVISRIHSQLLHQLLFGAGNRPSPTGRLMVCR